MKDKSARKIYIYTTLILLAFYCFEYLIYHIPLGPPATSCLFVVLFGFPCPVCGGSHAIQSLTYGHIGNAFDFNILVTFFVFIQIIISVIIIYDLLFSTQAFYNIYRYTLQQLRNRLISYGLALFLLCIWLVNIFKYYP